MPQKQNGKTRQGRQRSMKRPKAKKVKGRGLSRKRDRKERALRDPSLLDPLNPRLPDQTESDRPPPKPKPEAKSRVADAFLFAMMATKPKPTWRRATWNSADFMVCTVAEPQKKLPAFKPGKWSINAQRKIALYGHDAKNVNNFTLHFDHEDQCDSLDRLVWRSMVPNGEVHLRSPICSSSRSPT